MNCLTSSVGILSTENSTKLKVHLAELSCCWIMENAAALLCIFCKPKRNKPALASPCYLRVEDEHIWHSLQSTRQVLFQGPSLSRRNRRGGAARQDLEHEHDWHHDTAAGPLKPVNEERHIMYSFALGNHKGFVFGRWWPRRFFLGPLHSYLNHFHQPKARQSPRT